MRLIIYTKSLKDFLNLFDKTAELETLSLGDTWYPANGFADEQILEGKRRVGEIINFHYDFIGLVSFECIINGVFIKLNTAMDAAKQTYELHGFDYQLRFLTAKIIELNAVKPNTFAYHLIDF
jgi:hypothetical protein